MKRFSSLMLKIFIGMILLSIPQVGRTGILSILFEDEVEFNSRLDQEPNKEISFLPKFHPLEPPGDFLLFFNLFCEGNASGIGGTEALISRVDTVTTPTGGEALITMILCEFCECAQFDVESEEFENCRHANGSCATFQDVRFVFDAISDPNIPADPDFPEATRIMFTVTDHDPPINCEGNGELREPCDLGTLKLTHHCTHLFDAMGNIVKSIGSAYIFQTDD